MLAWLNTTREMGKLSRLIFAGAGGGALSARLLALHDEAAQSLTSLLCISACWNGPTTRPRRNITMQELRELTARRSKTFAAWRWICAPPSTTTLARSAGVASDGFNKGDGVRAGGRRRMDRRMPKRSRLVLYRVGQRRSPTSAATPALK